MLGRRWRRPGRRLDETGGLRGGWWPAGYASVTHAEGTLVVGARELAPATADERVVVLLSDGLSTAGEPAESALAGIDRLHVLCPLPGDEAVDAACLLAARGGGRMEPVRSLNELGPALTRLLE